MTTDNRSLADHMFLGWSISCTGCGAMEVVKRPDDLPSAVEVLKTKGWTADIIGGKALCPSCSGYAP